MPDNNQEAQIIDSDTTNAIDVVSNDISPDLTNANNSEENENTIEAEYEETADPDILAQQLKTSDPDRALEIEREILKLANINGLTSTSKWGGFKGRKVTYSGTVEDFLKYNSITFRDECQKYGGSADRNPFIAFLKTYGNKNSGVDPFLKDAQRWNILHNLVADRTLDEKQLSFKASVADQISLLLNPTLWEQPASDIKYIIDTYIWLKEAYNLPNFLINKYIIFACVPNIAVKDGKPAITNASYRDSKVRDNIVKAVLFANLGNLVNSIRDLWANFEPVGGTQEEKDASIEKLIASCGSALDHAAGNVSVDSSKINDADMVEDNISLFNQAVQESSIDPVDGTEQETDTIETGSKQAYSRSDKVMDDLKTAISKKINSRNIDAINDEIEKIIKELNK